MKVCANSKSYIQLAKSVLVISRLDCNLPTEIRYQKNAKNVAVKYECMEFANLFMHSAALLKGTFKKITGLENKPVHFGQKLDLDFEAIQIRSCLL